MKKSNHTQLPEQNSFLFGAVLGTIAGSVGLYFLGTSHGRKQLRTIIDAVEDLEETLQDEVGRVKDELNQAEGGQGEGPIGSLHAVLDKIQSSMPAKEIQKYFVKDGKFLK